MYKILTKGEMVASLRKKVGASQKDIKGKYTKNYITSIEKGTKVPDSTLVYIYSNIAEFAKRNNTVLSMTLEELLHPEEEKIKKVCKQIISDIKDCKMKDNKDSLVILIKDIKTFIEEYKINDMQQCEIYENLADLYFSADLKCPAKVYCAKTLELAMRSDNYEYVLNLIYNMTKVLRIKRDDLISFLGSYVHSVYDRCEDKNNKVFMKIFFNAAKANKHIGCIEESMMYFKLIENNFNLMPNQRYELKILKADCYFDLENYSQAENIYLNILSEAIDIENSNVVALTYINLSEIKTKTGNKNKSREYLKKAYEYKVDERYENIIKHISLKVYIELDEFNSINKLYDGVIKYLVKSKEEKDLYSILNKLVEYFIFKNEVNSLNIIADLVYNYIISDEIKNRNVIEVFFLIINYMLNIDIEKAKKISNMSTKCLEKLKQTVN